METLIMPIGIPGSGKTTFMKNISKKYNIPMVSSDSVREQLYGNEAIQGNGQKVFQEVYRQVNSYENCILDATNLSYKIRKKAINNVHPKNVIYIIMNNNLNFCLKNNSNRNRVVPEDVIIGMYNRLEKPKNNEFDNLNIFYYNDEQLFECLEELIKGGCISE